MRAGVPDSCVRACRQDEAIFLLAILVDLQIIISLIIIMERRVVVTGIGVIHALGEDKQAFYDALLSGKSGISRVKGFDPTDYNCQVGSECVNFKPENYMDPKDARRNDRFVQLAVAASRNAVKDASLDLSKEDASRVGVIIGSGVGGMKTMEEQVVTWYTKGPRRVSPFTIPMLITNMASGVVAIELKVKGPNYCVVSACASGSHAIGDAYNILKHGEAEVMVSGGSEAAITGISFASFCSMKAMATEFNDTPEKSSRPFDAKRCGFVMGEGAGVLILETLEHARARGARILAEVIGYGASSDGFHITQPDPEGTGLMLCMKKALQGVNLDEVGYINAHGTSTLYNDKFETLAFKKVLGEERARRTKISSTKSMTGHLLGAAGGVEAAITTMALVTGELPPTINYENPDPDCDLDYIPNHSIKHQAEVAISDNLGFGGQNACLAFRRWKE
jgi:3-oxoacyl-[acyl-carrier-protein] synthase II